MATTRGQNRGIGISDTTGEDTTVRTRGSKGGSKKGGSKGSKAQKNGAKKTTKRGR